MRRTIGAAYVAAVGIGALDDWDAITRFVRPAGVVHPDPSTAAAYRHAYGLYRDIYPRLKSLYPSLQALQN